MKLGGHPVYGQGRAIFEKEESHRHEGDEKRGKGGVTKRSVTEVIRVVQVARTKGPFYYRVPLSSHARFENSSVSRVAIIFSLVFSPLDLGESANLCRAALNGSSSRARKRVASGNGVVPCVTCTWTIFSLDVLFVLVRSCESESR